ncbi:5-methylcytosine restriction system specificity protein McrC, partial [Leucobacter salsicius]|uniref:5-methylcytosine restriction system specificity protein McrC n=1 Tax=Leucobacter salsicius TaxID=664638 RepID=UPI00036BDEFB
MQHPTLVTLPPGTFDALEAFVLSQELEEKSDGMHFFSLGLRRGVGKIIVARNYVGVITLTDGTVIEVLPKIAGGGVTHSEARKVFLDMLRTVDHVAFKSSNRSHLAEGNVTLFEIFIEMFLLEAARVVQQGLKSSYVSVQSDEGYFKGRLLVAQNIKENLVRRDRFYVEQ